MAENTVTLTIDGVPVTIEKGKKIYDAASKAGVYIPGLCYDPKLTRFGGCRMCIVDVTNSRGRTASKWACCEPVADGITVTTDNDKIRKRRQMMMEFLLAWHPLDCPTCNKSGECGLQDATVYINQKHGSRIPTKRRDEPLLMDNPVIEKDFNRCILCGKCVIICDEIQGNRAIDFQRRGFWAEVGTPFRIPLECDYCGQCLHVCPVGSILDHTERFRGHSWEYNRTQTTCPYCAVGCSIFINEKSGKVMKVTSRDDAGINNGNLCARGRFGHEAFQPEDRIRTALIKQGNRLEPASWEEALDRAAGKLKEIKEKHGEQAIAVIGGESLSNEDAYALQKVFRAGLGVTSIDNMANMRNPLLNSGLFEEFGASAPIVTYDAIKSAGSFLFFGCDAEKENPVIANMVRVAMRDNGTPLYVANARNTLFLPIEDARIAMNYGAEASVVSGLIRAAGEAMAEKPANAGDIAKTATMDVEAAAKAAGVAVEDIKKIAAGLAKNGAPLILIGNETVTNPKSAEIVKGLCNLAALLGGKALLYREYCNSQGVNDMGVTPSNLPGYLKADSAEGAAHYSSKWGVELAPAKASDGDIIKRIQSGAVKAVVLAGVDIITQYPGGASIKKALEGMELVVVTSQFVNETVLSANVVLPSASAVERDGTYTNNEGRVQLVRKAVEPAGRAKPEWEIFREIGARLGLAVKHKETRDVTDEIIASVPGYEGMTTLKLSEGEAVVSYPKDGKPAPFQFNAGPFNASAAGFTHVVITGNSLYHLGSLSRHSKTLNEIESRATVEMGLSDAQALKLEDGEEALVESANGSIRAKVKITPRSKSGVVFVTKNFENAPAMSLLAQVGEPVMARIVKAHA